MAGSKERKGQGGEGVREKEQRGREVKEPEGRLTLMRKEGPIHVYGVYQAKDSLCNTCINFGLLCKAGTNHTMLFTSKPMRCCAAEPQLMHISSLLAPVAWRLFDRLEAE